MFKKIILFLFIIILLFFIAPVGFARLSYANKVFSIESVPAKPVILVLGAGVYGKTPSPILQDRLLVAKELYDNKKGKKIILSGDNSQKDYNEPIAMKKFLVENGVPEADLILDYAGFRTYDSCYRLKEVFDQKEAIIVTQNFHLPRALYLCNSLGVDAVGVASDKRDYLDINKLMLREIPASWQAFYEINVEKPQPKFLGPKEKVF